MPLVHAVVGIAPDRNQPRRRDLGLLCLSSRPRAGSGVHTAAGARRTRCVIAQATLGPDPALAGLRARRSSALRVRTPAAAGGSLSLCTSGRRWPAKRAPVLGGVGAGDRAGDPGVHDGAAPVTRDQIRGWLIIIGLALIATVFFNVSQQIAGIVFGALGLLFIVLMWYFGYSWYRDNLTAISLMPDRQRNALYGGAGALTGAAAMWSLDKFGLIDSGRVHAAARADCDRRRTGCVLGLAGVQALLPVTCSPRPRSARPRRRSGPGGFRWVRRSSSRIWSGPTGSRCSIGCGPPSRSRGCRRWAAGWSRPIALPAACWVRARASPSRPHENLVRASLGQMMLTTDLPRARATCARRSKRRFTAGRWRSVSPGR